MRDKGQTMFEARLEARGGLPYRIVADKPQVIDRGTLVPGRSATYCITGPSKIDGQTTSSPGDAVEAAAKDFGS